MLIKLALMYFLLSGIVAGLQLLNLDDYYEDWCKRHKNASIAERYHIKEIIEDLKSDLLLSMSIALSLGWLLVPLASIDAIKSTIQKLSQL